MMHWGLVSGIHNMSNRYSNRLSYVDIFIMLSTVNGPHEVMFT